MTLESNLRAKLEWAWNDGSPVAGQSLQEWSETASIARRRWYSYARRNENKPDTLDNRVEDLARGLCEKFETGGLKMAGPLIEDYRWLARQLAKILVVESE